MASLPQHLSQTVPVTAGPLSLRKLLDAVLSLHSDLDLRGLLRRIVRHAVDLVDARDGVLGVLDETGTRLALLVTPYEATFVSATGLAENQWFFSRIIAEARPMRLRDLGDDLGYDRMLLGDRPKAFLTVPIWTRGTVFGHLCLTDKTTAEAFSVIDEELLVSLAAAASVAVENAERHALSVRRGAAHSV